MEELIGDLGGWLSFLQGVLCGAVAVVALLYFALLQMHAKVQDKERKLDQKAAEAKLTEQEAQKILQAALPGAMLAEGQTPAGGGSDKPASGVPLLRNRTSDSVASEPTEGATEALMDIDLETIEENWQTLMRVSKDRQRDIRNLVVFLQEFVQLHQQISRTCHKLAKHGDNMFQSSEDASISRWSKALTAALAQLSSHAETLGITIAGEIEQRLSKMGDEHLTLEKTLGQEASRLMKELKDALNEHQQAEATRDRMVVKLEQAAEKGQKFSAKDAVQTKHIRRLQVAEADAQETNKSLMQIKHIFLTKMPRVHKDFKLMMFNEQSLLQEVLLRFSQLMLQSEDRRIGVYSRLQVDLSSSHLSTGSAYDSMMENALNQATQTTGLSKETPKLDMASEAAAALASSLPASLPPFPDTLKDSVQPETAVWFNAFLGRLYRDLARSEVFHDWLLAKLHFQLNKGKLPEFIDELHVSDLKFGASPPLLRNLRWVPVRHSDGQDVEYDVVFTSDILFRGGLGFSVTTKLWVNWPRDRYAFLPVRVDLELSELMGTIRFGVTKHNTFVCFTEEPFTRFTVQSSVGNNLKFENLPKVSNIIVNRIKRSIRNRLVQPKAHRFRLFWPQKWWPDVTSEMLAAQKLPGASHAHATAKDGAASGQAQSTQHPPELVDPAQYAELHGHPDAKDSPRSLSTSSSQRRSSADFADHPSARQFIGRMLRKKHTPRSSASQGMDEVPATPDSTQAAASTSGLQPSESDRNSRRKASHMAASLGNKLRQAMAHRPPVHMMSTPWLRPRRSSDVSQMDAKDSMPDDLGPVDMEYDEDEDEMLLHPGEAELAESTDGSVTDDEEAEETRARWAQLLEAAHRHVEDNNQEGVEISAIPRAPMRFNSLHFEPRLRVVSTDLTSLWRSESDEKEAPTDLRQRRRSRSLSDFRTAALLAATDDTKDDQSHPNEKIGLGYSSPRTKASGIDDSHLGLRSSPASSVQHHRSASDGVPARDSILSLPSLRALSSSFARKGARQVPLPFDPTASGVSIMKGNLKVVKPGLTASLALARWRWVEIQAGVLKIFEHEGDIIPKSTYAMRSSTCRPLSTNAAFEVLLGTNDFSDTQASQEPLDASGSSPRASSTDQPITKPRRLILQAESEALSRAWIIAIQASANA